MEKLDFYSLTFVGRRENNQDSCTVLKLNQGTYFLAVADGMGGAAGGKIASKTVLEIAEKILREKIKIQSDKSDLKSILNEIFEKAHQKINTIVAEKPGLEGMGTTLACVLIHENTFVVGNIGDSRVYLFRDDSLEQLTEDHTYIQDFKNKSSEKIDDAIKAHYSHLLLKSIDGKGDAPDIFPLERDCFELKEGDGFILCSDGLISDKTSENNEILTNYLTGSKSLQQAAENLVSHAFHQGSSDNITVVLATYGKFKRNKLNLPKYTFPPSDTQKIKPKKKVVPYIILVFLFIILGFLALQIFDFTRSEISDVPEQVEKRTQTSDSISPDTPNQPAILDDLKWSETGEIPMRLNESISWIEPQLANDEIEYYKVFCFSGQDDRNLLKEIKVTTTYIELNRFPLEREKNYSFKVVGVTKGKLISESEIITIKTQ